MNRKDRRWVFLATVFLCSLVVFRQLFAGDAYLVKAKKIYTATHGIIEDGAILIEGGKISKIGKNFPAPKNIRILEAYVVIPGLIDVHSHQGLGSIPRVTENMDGNEMTNPSTPQVKARDSFNFDDPILKLALAGGVTTIVARQGSGNVIGGTSVAVKLKNAPPEEMILKEVCDLKMAMDSNPAGIYRSKKQMPSTLSGVYLVARQAFVEAQEYRKSWESYEKDKKQGLPATPPKRDPGKDVLVRVLKREIPVHAHCFTASDIMTCIRLADEFNLRLTLGHCNWAYLVVDELAKRKDVYPNVGPGMFASYLDNLLQFKNCPAILANAGIKVSLQTDSVLQQHLREWASLAVRYGMKVEDAVKAITIWEAEASGLEDRIGSLDVGKDADLVALNGEPFEFLTSVDKVMIDGKIEYQRENPAPAALQVSLPEAKGALAVPPDIKSSRTFALKGGTIFTMAGSPLKNGVILVKDGKIEKIGADISIPQGYPVVDAQEFVIMPGHISPRLYSWVLRSWRNLFSADEISRPVVPDIEVKHAIEPQSLQFHHSREVGITTALITPGNANVIGGQGVALKTAGSIVDRMIVKDKAVMVFGFGASAKRIGQMPSTRMGIAALLRETLVKAQEYREKVEKYEKDKSGSAPQRDLSLEALLPVLRGEMRVLVHAEREDDILTALRIADEFKLKIILDGAADAYKVVDEIKKRDIPVILEGIFRGTGNVEDIGFNTQNPTILAKAGIRIAFTSEESWGDYFCAAGIVGGDLSEVAAFAVRNGMPEDAALRAITINAATIIGAAARVGSLEPGKDADILVLRGHPLRTGSVPEAVFIDGKLVFQREESAHF